MASIPIQKNVSLTYIATVSSIALGALYFHQRKKLKSDDNQKNPLPEAPYSVTEIIQELSGSNYPWFLLNIAKTLNSVIFRYANMEYLIGCKLAVVIGDGKTVHKILSDPLSFKPRNIYGAFDSITVGYSTMFSSNGEIWHSKRKGMSPAFSSKHLKRMKEVAIQKVEEWIDARLPKFIENEEAFDVGEEMLGITLSAVSETAFEYVMTEEEKKEYAHELDLSLMEFTNKSSVNPLRRFFGIFYEDRRRAHIASQRVTALSKRFIDSYHSLENPVKDTILDRIMKNEAYKNDDDRAADVTSLLIAGHDTTAYSIAWILKEIAKNPSIQQDLQQSLATFEKDEFGKSPVLRNIVKEGMRLHPVATGGSIRKLGRDIETRQGYLLPKGTVAFMPFILHLRDPAVFDDPHSFIPSRWENPTNEMNESFYPFSSGKQNCIGQSLASTEILNIVPRICSEFKLELVEEGTTEYFLTLKPKHAMIKATKSLK